MKFGHKRACCCWIARLTVGAIKGFKGGWRLILPPAFSLSLFIYKIYKEAWKRGFQFWRPSTLIQFPLCPRRGEESDWEREREKKMHKLLSDRSSEKRGRVLLDAGKEEGWGRGRSDLAALYQISYTFALSLKPSERKWCPATNQSRTFH